VEKETQKDIKLMLGCKIMVAEPEGSTPLTPEPAIGQNLELVQYTFHPHNLSP
jgi:hypothetical protein